MRFDMLETIRMWHTPYIGAYLLWRFATGFASASSGRAAPIMLFFIVAALVTDKIYYEPVWKRNFRTYHRYFVENKNRNLSANGPVAERMLPNAPYVHAATMFPNVSV